MRTQPRQQNELVDSLACTRDSVPCTVQSYTANPGGDYLEFSRSLSAGISWKTMRARCDATSSCLINFETGVCAETLIWAHHEFYAGYPFDRRTASTGDQCSLDHCMFPRRLFVVHCANPLRFFRSANCQPMADNRKKLVRTLVSRRSPF
jgi:hypothetical protein